MRKVLLTIVISTLSLLGLSVYAQNGFTTSLTGQKDLPLKDIRTNGSDKLQRNLPFTKAYILGQTVIIDFSYLVENVTVVITNITTGEIAHSEVYNLQDNAIIQLNAEAADYRIDIISESLILEGEFTL